MVDLGSFLRRRRSEPPVAKPAAEQVSLPAEPAPEQAIPPAAPTAHPADPVLPAGRNAALQVGDAVFFGGHGASIVDGLETIEQDGHPTEYLRLVFPHITIRSPRGAPVLSPLDAVMGTNGVADALAILADPTPPDPGSKNWSRFFNRCDTLLRGYGSEEELSEDGPPIEYDVRNVALALRLLRDRLASGPQQANSYRNLQSKARGMLVTMIAITAGHDNAWAEDAIEQALARSAPPA